MQPNQPGQEQNPFLELLAQRRTQGGQQPQGDMSGIGGQDAMMPGLGIAEQMMQQPESSQQNQPLDPTSASTQKGQTGDTTKFLTQAMSAIHNFLAQSTDRGNVAIGRSIIGLLSQLIMRDQQRAGQTDQRYAQMMNGQGGQ